MKFAANIPSYLKTGQGIFPVKESSMPKRIESTNFYENAKQGFNMPTTNETSMPSFAPVGDITNSSDPINATFIFRDDVSADGAAPGIAPGSPVL